MAWKWLSIVLSATIACLLIVFSSLPIFIREGKASVLRPRVSTPQGQYVGKVLAKYGNLPKDTVASSGMPETVVRYAGIPFAKPPLGDLRFKRPEPLPMELTPEKVTSTENFKRSCWAITKSITNPYYSEDCLYLNIYVPNENQGPNAKYPVMIWIHGGGFVAGTMFPEPKAIVDQGRVLVVTFTYRLGPFGFLNTENDALPTNIGLWDQVMAMQWVKDNIEYFGGHSDSITIFGESAGAMSAAIHTISPVSSSLFNKAIFQSGVASSLLTRNPVETAENFGRVSGCNQSSTTPEFASCIRNLTTQEILEYSRSIDINEGQKQLDFIWMPSIDGELILDEPSKLLNNMTYLASIDAFSKDYMFGMNNNEGSLVIDNFLNRLSLTDVQNLTFLRNLVDYVLSMKYDTPPQDLSYVRDIVIEFYTGSPSPDYIRPESVMNFVGDAIFYSPTLQMAKALSGCYQGSSTVCDDDVFIPSLKQECIINNTSGRSHVYLFDFCPSDDDACKTRCMVHGLDVSYQFPKTEFVDVVKKQLSDNFMAMVSSFAKQSPPMWPAYDTLHQSYYRFSPHSDVRRRLYHYRMDLWTRMIPELLNSSRPS